LRRGAGRWLAGAFAVAALSLLVWLPPPLPAWGLDSFSNQLGGALGVPASWGGIPLGSVTGIALVVRWGLEYVVPSAFVLASVVDPGRAFAPLRATGARLESVPAPRATSFPPLTPSPGGSRAAELGRTAATDRRGGPATDAP